MLIHKIVLIEKKVHDYFRGGQKKVLKKLIQCGLTGSWISRKESFKKERIVRCMKFLRDQLRDSITSVIFFPQVE